jgi:hypothetical protein
MSIGPVVFHQAVIPLSQLLQFGLQIADPLPLPFHPLLRLNQVTLSATTAGCAHIQLLASLGQTTERAFWPAFGLILGCKSGYRLLPLAALTLDYC